MTPAANVLLLVGFACWAGLVVGHVAPPARAALRRWAADAQAWLDRKVNAA